jgi:Ca-activated chloride channel family protein
MSIPAETQIPIAAAVAALLLVLAGEKLHARRCRAAGRLATGPSGRPRDWVKLVPPVKALTVACMAWALVTLLYRGGGVFGAHDPAEEVHEGRHVVFVADLSPSMRLRDAGQGRDLTRAERIGEVVDGILRRLGGSPSFSVVGFYTEAMPVVADARDPQLVRNVFDGLPLWYVMKAGKTDLGGGVRKTLELLADYPEKSATVFICTDGDTIPPGSLPQPPASIRRLYVLGAGDPHRGSFIDDHMSRQDASTLRSLAGRLGGVYIDVNEKHVTTLTLGELAVGAASDRTGYDRTDLAVFLFAGAALVHALIPVMLQYFGSDWKPARSRQSIAT